MIPFWIGFCSGCLATSSLIAILKIRRNRRIERMMGDFGFTGQRNIVG